MVNTSVYFSALFMVVLSDVHDVLLRLPGILLSGLFLNVQFLDPLQALFLIDVSSIVSFFCVSLGPWCFLLRLATLHPSQLARVRIFLRSASSTKDTTLRSMSRLAGLMLSRHHSLLFESLPAGCTRGYASCVHHESSVSPQHALPRAAGGLLVLQRRTHQNSTALVVVLQHDFMSLDFTNSAPTQHPSSCSSHVRSSSTMFVHCRISLGFS